MRVVSLPATIRSTKYDSSSHSAIGAPITSAVASTDARSSRGAARLASTISRKYVNDVCTARSFVSRVRGAVLEVRILARDDRVRQVEHQLPVLARHADHVGDDGERDGGREVLDEVGLATRREARERLVDDLADGGALGLERLAA